jgi:hypothetical protein
MSERVCALDFGFVINAAVPSEAINHEIESLVRAYGTILGVQPMLGMRTSYATSATENQFGPDLRVPGTRKVGLRIAPTPLR